jgi:hypothetical protein
VQGTWLGWDVLYEYTHPLLYNHQTHNNTPCGVDGTSCPTTSTTNNYVVVKSTDRRHATISGVLSHVLAVSVLVGTGLFASVLAPPAATSVICDLTVRTEVAKPYNELAGKVVRQLFWHPKNHPSAAHAAVVTRN